jgi:phenylacetate-CoA ligase
MVEMNQSRVIRPSFRDRLQFLFLGPRDWLLYAVCGSYKSFLFGFEHLPPGYLAWSSEQRARRAFFQAARSVPAYTRFLEAQGASPASIPEMDKESYIKKHTIEERCVGERMPDREAMIDESSGSMGTPFNWIRSPGERRQSQLFISYFATYFFGDRPWITINAFSMGAWATGLNMGIALQRNSVVKNTGPDLGKILDTLRFLGPKHPYLILGYPPFMKHLIDVAEERGFPLQDYTLNALVGGEGMSEGLRDYLLRRFKKVYSGYGATDLEIGIAGETPLTVAIRRLARELPELRQRIFGADARLPMLFQYNPLMHHVEVNPNRELVFTITRSSLLSPRIRYNIHDEGGVLRFDEMKRTLKDAGHDIRQLALDAGGSDRLRLPFLWIYGRRDYTISVMGANIYPEDLEQCLYAEPELARMTRSFCLSVVETPGSGVRPCFLFEVESELSEALRVRFAERMLTRLVAMNADFREAFHEYPDTVTPEIRLHAVGEGPFASDSGKIKQTRLLNRV